LTEPTDSLPSSEFSFSVAPNASGDQKGTSVKADERVLVVPSVELDRLGRFQGFSPDADRYLSALLVPQLMDYRPRSQVEDDPSRKHIIPYVVFRCGGGVFGYTPGK